MDPRRFIELYEAAAKGAARRAAADATQRSVQGALRSENGDARVPFETLPARLVSLKSLDLQSEGKVTTLICLMPHR